MRVQNIVYNLLGNPIKCEFWKIHILNKRERWRSVLCNNYCSKKSDNVQKHVYPIEKIRNFSIIAHVDHGKSTLADRLLEMTGAIKVNSGKQVLDKLQVEKDRGITVKAQTASLSYTHQGEEYLLNLIDTPGHVDFSNEVSRSLIACQGVILLVDANDGVQAQTVANFYLAFEQDLCIIPVINKVDLKNADPDRVVKQLQTLFDIEESEVIKISAKFGTGVDKVLEAIVERLPPPSVSRDKPLKALLFDSWYERHKGPVALVYIHEGSLSVEQNVTSVHTGKSYEVKALSLLRPEEEFVQSLSAGQVGCIISNMKTSAEAHIGDTFHLANKPVEPLPGFKPLKPMVYAGIYPMDQSQHVALRTAIEKLVLNDSAVTFTVESSPALGHGWRLGFLGLLHMEVFTQRLEQEHDTESILTAPSVTYKAKIVGQKHITKHGTDMISFNNPAHFPDPQIIAELYEPMVIGTIITPVKYLGDILALCKDRRGVEKSTVNIDNDRLVVQFHLPLNEIVIDFHDKLKSVSSGYASFDYEDNEYQISNITKLYVLLNGIIVEELCVIVHISKAHAVGKHLSGKLVTIIPRQQFEIVIQIKVEGKIIIRETIKPYRKDVTAKLHGGDITRKKKLLAKQALGKKKMKMIGSVALPRETFISVLKK